MYTRANTRASNINKIELNVTDTHGNMCVLIKIFKCLNALIIRMMISHNPKVPKGLHHSK